MISVSSICARAKPMQLRAPAPERHPGLVGQRLLLGREVDEAVGVEAQRVGPRAGSRPARCADHRTSVPLRDRGSRRRPGRPRPRGARGRRRGGGAASRASTRSARSRRASVESSGGAARAPSGPSTSSASARSAAQQRRARAARAPQHPRHRGRRGVVAGADERDDLVADLRVGQRPARRRAPPARRAGHPVGVRRRVGDLAVDDGVERWPVGPHPRPRVQGNGWGSCRTADDSR